MAFWRRLLGKSGTNQAGNRYSIEFAGDISLAGAMEIAQVIERRGGDVTKFDVKQQAAYASRISPLPVHQR